MAKDHKIAIFASNGVENPDDISLGSVGRMCSLHLARLKGWFGTNAKIWAILEVLEPIRRYKDDD